MENLKKNFEEPVVQIINMCFCENIATSGAIACPKNSSTYSATRQQCKRCKVIYAREGSVDSIRIGKTNEDYIGQPGAIKEYLDLHYSGLDLNEQVNQYASILSCPANVKEKL